MQNHFYDIQKYETILKNELTKLRIIAVVFVIIFIATAFYCFYEIKKYRTEKIHYTILIFSVLLFVFLEFYLGLQIASYKKDIAEKAYMQYEGPAICKTERRFVYGGTTTNHDEYTISFDHDGTQIELYTRKDYRLPENMEQIYIVYSKHSRHIIEIIE